MHVDRVMVGTGYGAEALDALAGTVDAAKRDDPMAPVTVVVPSSYAGLSVRRVLGARSGLLNVRFMVAPRLAELLAGGRIVGKRDPLTPALRSAAVRAVLADDPGPFRAVAGHVSTARALESTFRDLRELADDELARIAAASPRSAHVVALFRAFRHRTRGYYDAEDLFEAAADVVSSQAGALRDIGQVMLYLPREQTAGQVRLWKAISSRGALTVVAGFAGESPVDGHLQQLAHRLGVEPPEAPSSVSASDPGTRVLTASDADEEVRNVIRLIGAELDSPDGAPLHRIAVLYPSADPYAGIGSELFAAAGIPTNGPGDRKLAHSLAGRVLLALVSFSTKDFDRHAVMDFLALPVNLPGEGAHPAQRWDYLSREASVTRGLDQWRTRLEARARKLRADAETQKSEGRERLADRLGDDAGLCDDLLACVESLAHEVDFAHLETWDACVEHALALLDRYLPIARVGNDDAEIAAHQEIRDAVLDIRTLGEIRPDCTPDDFFRVIEQVLQAPWGRAGSFDNGVFVASLSAARGTDFDLVFILGMVEGALPHNPREDPLLPDHERAKAPSLHARAESRIVRDREDYLAACAIAPRRILCFPAAELRSQRKNLPSRWLLEACTALAGRRIFTADFSLLIETPGNTPWMLAIPSLQSGLSSSSVPPGSLLEFDLRSLLASGNRLLDSPYVRDTPELARAIESVHARASHAFTEWDGFLGADERLDLSAGDVASPTGLEKWSKCGFQYALDRVLRIAPTREPESALRMSPLERGSLIHGLLEQFFRDRGPGKAPDDGWSADDREYLRKLADAACQEAENAGIVGKPLLWRLTRQQILRELDALLSIDEERRRTLRATFAAAEFAFGNDEREPVSVPFGNGALRFRGRIDRVDRCDDGSVIVYDYKTGSDFGARKLDENPLDNGRRLQLPVYALAAMQHLDAPAARAAYWFTREDMRDNPREFVDLDPAELLTRQLSETAAQIAAGVFPIRSGKWDNGNFENCRFCDYDRLCHRERERSWHRKGKDHVIERYRRLVEGGIDLLANDAGEDEE